MCNRFSMVVVGWVSHHQKHDKWHNLRRLVLASPPLFRQSRLNKQVSVYLPLEKVDLHRTKMMDSHTAHTGNVFQYFLSSYRQPLWYARIGAVGLPGKSSSIFRDNYIVTIWLFSLKVNSRVFIPSRPLPAHSILLLLYLPPCLLAYICLSLVLPSWCFPLLLGFFLSSYRILLFFAPPLCHLFLSGSPSCWHTKHLLPCSQYYQACLLPQFLNTLQQSSFTQLIFSTLYP